MVFGEGIIDKPALGLANIWDWLTGGKQSDTVRQENRQAADAGRADASNDTAGYDVGNTAGRVASQMAVANRALRGYRCWRWCNPHHWPCCGPIHHRHGRRGDAGRRWLNSAHPPRAAHPALATGASVARCCPVRIPILRRGRGR